MKIPAFLIAVIGIIVIVIVSPVLAQKYSISPYSGSNSDRYTNNNTGTKGGISFLHNYTNKPFSLGLDANRGSSFYDDEISIYNVSSLLLMASLSSSRFLDTANAKYNRFMGPVFGIAVGPALVRYYWYSNSPVLGQATRARYHAAGNIKLFCQANYSFGKEGKFGVFIRFGLNSIFNKPLFGKYMKGYALSIPELSFGCKFTLKT